MKKKYFNIKLKYIFDFINLFIYTIIYKLLIQLVYENIIVFDYASQNTGNYCIRRKN